MDSPKKSLLNAITVDIEGFVESNLQSFHIPQKYIDPQQENKEIQINTERMLEFLDNTNTKATFFFVGRIARDMPDLIRKAAGAGHEIGCHNFAHLRVFGIKPSEFKEKVSSAKERIEVISGKQVYGFRAPDFSITKDSAWALDILKEIGFVYDSSIFPFGFHDVYGMKDAKPSINKLPNGLIEFPMSTSDIFGKRFPFGGGGYFRLYPLFLTKYFIKKTNRLGLPCMFYIHPYEAGPIIPHIKEMSAYRSFRHYHNCSKVYSRLKKILEVFKFVPAIQVLKEYEEFKIE